MPWVGHPRTVIFARPAIVSQSEWETSLAAVTEREKAVAAAIDQLAAARKRMPMVRSPETSRHDGAERVAQIARLR